MYQLRITGPGIEVGRPIDEGTALRIISLAMSSPLIATDEGGDEQLSNDVLRGVTIAGFLGRLNAGSNADRIAAIALYLQQELKRQWLPRDEVILWFQRALLQPPRNVSRDVLKALDDGVIEEDPGRPYRYRVTRLGRDKLLGQLEDDALVADDSRRQRRPEAATPSSEQPGPTQKIRELVTDGWFRTPRTAKEILSALESRGYPYKRTDLTRQLQTLDRREELRRFKKEDEATGRKVWYYQAVQDELFDPAGEDAANRPD